MFWPFWQQMSGVVGVPVCVLCFICENECLSGDFTLALA